MIRTAIISVTASFVLFGALTVNLVSYHPAKDLKPLASLSTTVDWKSGLKNTFKNDQRTSGTWTLNNGVIIATVTASTDSNLRYQVYSWRVTNLGDRDLIAVDNQGRLRHEWKVR